MARAKSVDRMTDDELWDAYCAAADAAGVALAHSKALGKEHERRQRAKKVSEDLANMSPDDRAELAQQLSGAGAIDSEEAVNENG